MVNIIAEVIPLLQHASKFKHRAFNGEREWRVRKFNPNKIGKDILYKAGRFGLTPYMEFDLKKEYVRKIYIGPRIETEFAENTLDSFLGSNDYTDVEIAVSKIPFR
jgi:hypothetical protein